MREWFDDYYKELQGVGIDPDILSYIKIDQERIKYTINLLNNFGIKGKKVCEIGFGGIGLACRSVLKAEVDAYDYSNNFKLLCDHYSIPYHFIDLNQPGIVLRQSYDAILLLEVIEHINRWPVEIFSELWEFLVEGGLLLVTTPNLHRLSNRLRMVTGKRLFAHFTPEDLLMAHLREYTADELIFLLARAGFADLSYKMVSFPDARKAKWVQKAYKIVGNIAPSLSNYIVCLAFKKSPKPG